jgi:hypothetical protein
MTCARTGSLLLAAAILSCGLVAAARAAEPPAAAPGGMVIYRDPITGELTVPPADAVPAPSERRAPAEPLIEEPGTTPAGGWKMRMPQRFRHTMRATTGADGAPSTGCVPGSTEGTE